MWGEPRPGPTSAHMGVPSHPGTPGSLTMLARPSPKPAMRLLSVSPADVTFPVAGVPTTRPSLGASTWLGLGLG